MIRAMAITFGLAEVASLIGHVSFHKLKLGRLKNWTWLPYLQPDDLEEADIEWHIGLPHKLAPIAIHLVLGLSI
jgi:hypothetical protein